MPRKKRSRQGKVINYSAPVWEPLLELARIYIDEFMWMCEVELKDGSRLQAYKHSWTRRYLYLDDKGRAFGYAGEERYREVDPEELRRLFDLVVGRRAPFEDFEEEMSESLEAP